MREREWDLATPVQVEDEAIDTSDGTWTWLESGDVWEQHFNRLLYDAPVDFEEWQFVADNVELRNEIDLQVHQTKFVV